MTQSTESQRFVLCLQTSFNIFSQQQLNRTLLPPIGQQITIKFLQHVHVLGSNMLQKLIS